MQPYCLFMRGQGGKLTSMGVDYMAMRASQEANARIDVFNWDQTQAAADRILILERAFPADRILLIGFSLGANSITRIAAAMKTVKFARLIAIDPSIWSPQDPIGPNVDKAIVFRNWNFLNVFGLATLKPAAEVNPNRIETINVFDFHIFADDNPKYQQRIIDEIRATGRTSTVS